MNVTLNEPAIQRLLTSDPIKQYLAEGAQRTAQAVETKLSAIVHGRFQVEVGYQVTEDARGLKVEIGVGDSATARRLARKVQGEEGGWLEFARRAFDR